ncbi:ABC transporter substrate-binding protein [Devosia sp. 2618]|uniref:ABC transporter substrate-binding protein n=1 Tax=Devosia sp. 2618 TaxID=3156454 RepID=UPI0033997451
MAEEWSWTDASGKEIVLDHTPKRIVMWANSAAALMPLGITPVGVFADEDPKIDPNLRYLDLTGVDIVSETWESVDAERILALDPDLIITEFWLADRSYAGAIAVGGTQTQLEKAIPIIGIAQGSSIVTMIEDYTALAIALGIPPDDTRLTEGRASFEDARDGFKAALAAKPGLQVLAGGASEDELYLAVAHNIAELSDFASWGMNFVDVGQGDEINAHYNFLSWENIQDYPADLFMVDARTGKEDIYATLANHPLANRIPAVAAEQLTDWPAYWLRSYDAYAAELLRLTSVITTLDSDVVP